MKYTGELQDNRPKKLKDKDFDSREVDLGEIKYVTYKQAQKTAQAYVERNQKSKSSCVPSSMCNALWHTEKEILSDEYLYTQRANKPQEGCWWHDIADKVLAQGTCKRSLLKEVFTEAEANSVKLTLQQEADAFLHRQSSYIWLKERDFNAIASAINAGYPVPFSIWANRNEWAREKPLVLDPKLTRDKSTIHHAICAIPNTAYKTKDGFGFFITDSAHFGGFSKRDITKEFYEARHNAGLYFVDFEFAQPKKWVTPAKYKGYKFTRDLTVEMQGEDVKALQEILKANGYFPKMNTTSFFGGITRQAVKDFQKDYEESILWSVGLKLPTGYFGKQSRRKIEELLTAKFPS
jgi:hypothetical protein